MRHYWESQGTIKKINSVSQCKTPDEQPVKVMSSDDMRHSNYQAFHSVISLLVRLHDFPAYVQATNYSPAMKS